MWPTAFDLVFLAVVFRLGLDIDFTLASTASSSDEALESVASRRNLLPTDVVLGGRDLRIHVEVAEHSNLNIVAECANSSPWKPSGTNTSHSESRLGRTHLLVCTIVLLCTNV